MHDFKFAFRGLLKSRGFAVVSILTLALGIGLNTSMFSLMNMLILQPLPFPDKDHLVRLYRATPQSQTADHSAADYLELARESKDFAELAGYRMWGLTMKQEDRPAVNLNTLRVSGNFFSVLGQQPELGRFFTADEDHPGSNVIILSHATWQAQFGGDPNVIGRTVRINGLPTIIVGVMPQTFSSVFLWGPGDAFQPFALTDTERLNHDDNQVRILARYHTDLTLAQLNARFANLAERLAAQRPPPHIKDDLRAATLQSTVANPGTRSLSWLLVGLAAFVLLIACANLANLQLARAAARAHEFAIRSALGASRARLLRPLLVESVLLSLFGGLFGVLVALWANDWISSRLSANGVVTFTLSIDWRVVLFAFLVSLGTGLAFGLAPAWLMSRVRVNETLKGGGRGTTGDRSQHRFRHSLIVVQFALALTLVAGAVFYVRGIDRMLSRDVGWDRHSIIQCVLNLPQAKYPTPTQTYAFYTQLQERLAALPGVENVAVGWTLPIFQFLTSRSYVVEGREPPPAGREPVANINAVTPSYLGTLKIRLLSGRNFTETDNSSSRPVVIINDSMARALFPNDNPLGRRIGNPDAAKHDWAEIIGVMPDLHMAVNFGPPPAQFQVFKPLAQETWTYVSVAVRAPAADTLAGAIRHVIEEMNSDLPVQQLRTVDQFVANFGGFSMVSTILICFALLGLFLAAIGLYGVIARLVQQRTPEIGVRIALGAQPRNVLLLILGSGLRLIGYGTAIGLLGAYGLGRLFAAGPTPIQANDPLALLVAASVLVAVAFFACWLPARRATKVDPMVALRAE